MGKMVDCLLLIAYIAMAFYCLIAMSYGWPLSNVVIWFAASNAFWSAANLSIQRINLKSDLPQGGR